LIDRRWHSSILDVRSFRRADCENDAKGIEKLAVKQAAQKFDVEIFHPRKLSELEVMKEYQIKISKRFAALKN
jgi:hypothetical protein